VARPVRAKRLKRHLLCLACCTQEGMLFYTRCCVALHVTRRKCVARPVGVQKLKGTFFALHVAHRKACFSLHVVVLPCMLHTGSVWLVLFW
jgi:hypothetical protein